MTQIGVEQSQRAEIREISNSAEGREGVRSVHALLRGEGIWLLTAPKPINMPGWWKRKFASLQMLATRVGGGGGHLSKG